MSVVVDPRGDTVEPMGQAEYCCFLRLSEALAETSADQNFSLASGYLRSSPLISNRGRMPTETTEDGLGIFDHGCHGYHG
jgi:hypothetical protein